ncbi:hypothetical protein [Nocardioides jejuensis]|uniref:DUF4232 domain-containing protein n=1 Tax=Nocardioides jejuensis TaxID=2502782 RepID=A0A4R1C0Z0_9ACTN|nr:hypothetical protein [Nocardioides jejuensis]TCJ23697.1 hypothetical protein EPD65_10535 [Nocardioides jejuensis]
MSATPSATNVAPVASACHAEQLTASYDRKGEGATGHFVRLLRIRNVAATPCILRGRPLRVEVRGADRSVPVLPGSWFVGMLGKPVPMSGTTTTSIGLEQDSICTSRDAGGPPEWFRGRIALKLTTGWVVSPGAHRFDIGCPLRFTDFGM